MLWCWCKLFPMIIPINSLNNKKDDELNYLFSNGVDCHTSFKMNGIVRNIMTMCIAYLLADIGLSRVLNC